jgi:hypothetical protein
VTHAHTHTHTQTHLRAGVENGPFQLSDTPVTWRPDDEIVFEVPA